VSKEEAEGTPPDNDDPTGSKGPVWWQQLVASTGALQELAQAHWGLLIAELRLARSAVRTALVSAVLGVLLGLALCATLLALAAVALFLWLDSWILALGVLAAIILVCLIIALIMLRRCVTWMSLPGTRTQLHNLSRDVVRAPRRRGEGESP
jgi:apolipoprotein N-acyltransferase